MDNLKNIHQRRRRDLCMFIWGNYEKQLTLKDIANALSISERTCERIIHDRFHTRLKPLLNAVRFYKTIQNYTHQKNNISQSALENGFTDRQTFKRWWNRWVALSFDHQIYDPEIIQENTNSEYNEIIDRIISCIPDHIK
jgi:AraC-like DNA-binding protein